MRLRWLLLLIVGQACEGAIAAAEWQTFKQDDKTRIEYKIGDVHVDRESGLMLAEYQVMYVALTDTGAILLGDQMVVTCDAKTREIRAMFRNGEYAATRKDTGEQKVYSLKKFQPPEKIRLTTNQETTSIGAWVCQTAI